MKKYLVLLLTLLTTGGSLIYGNTLSEFREPLQDTSEQLSAAGPHLLAFTENHFEELLDLFQKLDKDSYGGEQISVHPKVQIFDALPNWFQRDLRQATYSQIFPKHFFL